MTRDIVLQMHNMGADVLPDGSIAAAFVDLYVREQVSPVFGRTFVAAAGMFCFVICHLTVPRLPVSSVKPTRLGHRGRCRFFVRHGE